MGCFNKVGFQSHLPIKAGDEIVLFICATHTHYRLSSTPIGNNWLIEPICLPIFGSYDEYGSICDIKVDDNVKAIENTFGYSMKEIIDAIDECTGLTVEDFDGKEPNSIEILEQMEKRYKNILTKLVFSQYWYYDSGHKIGLCYTMEHKKVYDKLSSLCKYRNHVNTFDEILKNENISKIDNVFNPNKTSYDINKYSQILDKKIKGLNLTDEEQTFYDMVQKENDVQFNDIKLDTLLTNYEMESDIRDFMYNMVMYNVVKIDLFKLKDNINSFANFNVCLNEICGNYSLSNYCNQSIVEYNDTFKTLNECYLEIINNIKIDEDE